MSTPVPFIWKFTVLETHLDTFHHMNHATYLQIFEQARWELITSRGYGLKEIQKLQIGPTILEVNIQYRRELLLREVVTVETTCPPFSGRIVKVVQRMLNSKGEEAAHLVVTLGLFDMKARKLIRPTKEWLHAMGLDFTASKPS